MEIFEFIISSPEHTYLPSYLFIGETHIVSLSSSIYLSPKHSTQTLIIRIHKGCDMLVLPVVRTLSNKITQFDSYLNSTMDVRISYAGKNSKNTIHPYVPWYALNTSIKPLKPIQPSYVPCALNTHY